MSLFRDKKGRFRKTYGLEKVLSIMLRAVPGAIKIAFSTWVCLMIIAFFVGFYKMAQGNKVHHPCNPPYIKAIYMVPAFILGCDLGKRVGIEYRRLELE